MMEAGNKVLLAWLAFMIVTACSPRPEGQAEDSGDLANHAIDFNACPVDGIERPLECAWVEVPAVRNDEGAGTLHIGLWRMPGAGEDRTALWLLNGGPGGAGSAFLEVAAELLDAGLEADIYMPDHRGTGNSEFLECPGAIGQPDLASYGAACSRELRERWGDRLDGFTTTEAAADLESLIARLRAPNQRVVVYGGSYGSHWAQRYLQLAPDQADAVLTDGTCMQEFCSFTRFDGSRDEALRRVLTDCADDPICAEQLGVGEDAFAVFRTLRTEAEEGTLCLPALPTLQAFDDLINVSLIAEPRLLPALLARLQRCEASDLDAIFAFVTRVNALYGGGVSPVGGPLPFPSFFTWGLSRSRGGDLVRTSAPRGAVRALAGPAARRGDLVRHRRGLPRG
ncbi:MAG: alpha/beta fold hydrolase [Myxococcota bacterium]